MSTLIGSIEELAAKDFERVVRVTLLGYDYGAKAAICMQAANSAGNYLALLESFPHPFTQKRVANCIST